MAMRRILTALTLGALLAAAAPASVVAPPDAGGYVVSATQGSCSPGVSTRALAYENIAGDTSDNDDRLWVCGNIPNLHNVSHTPSGGCNGSGVSGLASWNDCIDGLSHVGVPSGWRICVYSTSGYGNLIYSRGGGTTRTNLTGSQIDTASSIRFVSGSCPG